MAKILRLTSGHDAICREAVLTSDRSLLIAFPSKTRKTPGRGAPGLQTLKNGLRELVSGPVETPDERSRDGLHVRLCRLDVSVNTRGRGLGQTDVVVLSVPILALQEEAADRDPIQRVFAAAADEPARIFEAWVPETDTHTRQG